MFTSSARARSRSNSMSSLRREAQRGAVDVRGARRVLERGEDLHRVRIGFAARRLHGHVDRLLVAAARSGGRNRDDASAVAEPPADARHLPRQLVRRMRAVVVAGTRVIWPFDPRLSVPPKPCCSAPETDVMRWISGNSRNVLREFAHGRIGGGQRRAGRILHLHEDLAAILRRNELEADDAERDQGDRTGRQQPDGHDDRDRKAQRQRQDAAGIPIAQARECLREARDDAAARASWKAATSCRRATGVTVKDTSSDVSVAITTTMPNSLRNRPG